MVLENRHKIGVQVPRGAVAARQGVHPGQRQETREKVERRQKHCATQHIQYQIQSPPKATRCIATQVSSPIWCPPLGGRAMPPRHFQPKPLSTQAHSLHLRPCTCCRPQCACNQVARQMPKPTGHCTARGPSPCKGFMNPNPNPCKTYMLALVAHTRVAAPQPATAACVQAVRQPQAQARCSHAHADSGGQHGLSHGASA